jgi:hypothetical protein
VRHLGVSLDDQGQRGHSIGKSTLLEHGDQPLPLLVFL